MPLFNALTAADFGTYFLNAESYADDVDDVEITSMSELELESSSAVTLLCVDPDL